MTFGRPPTFQKRWLCRLFCRSGWRFLRCFKFSDSILIWFVCTFRTECLLLKHLKNYKKQCLKHYKWANYTHRIHVRYIYLHLVDSYGICRYIQYMDPVWSYGVQKLPSKSPPVATQTIPTKLWSKHVTERMLECRSVEFIDTFSWQAKLLTIGGLFVGFLRGCGLQGEGVTREP